jgi:hypothetical protein
MVVFDGKRVLGRYPAFTPYWGIEIVEFPLEKQDIPFRKDIASHNFRC